MRLFLQTHITAFNSEFRVTFFKITLGLIPVKFDGYVGFKILTAVVMKSIIFWDMTPCSPLKVNRHIAYILRVEE
jgi:hypothetical protein